VEPSQLFGAGRVNWAYVSSVPPESVAPETVIAVGSFVASVKEFPATPGVSCVTVSSP
jgi:hypothetical protein